MSIVVRLEYNYGYRWYTENGVSVKGFIFNQHDDILEGADLAAYFADIVPGVTFEQKLEAANGMFAVIIHRDENVYFAVDRCRTFPLFFSVKDNDFSISDKSELISAKRLSKQNVREFLYTGYVTGRGTLLEDVFQAESGSYYTFRNGLLKQSYYFQCERTNVHDADNNNLEQSLVRIMDKVGERLVRKLNGKTAVIPLSGGYDSRIIATLLKKQNYSHVITFTYGIPSSPEVATSKKVAKQLGFPWYFIEYTKTLINGFVNSDEFREYYPFASNNVSGFFTQDYFAVKHLKEHKLIPRNSVFLPGQKSNGAMHGHFVAGIDADNVVERLIKYRYNLRKDPMGFESKIKQEMLFSSANDNFLNWSSKEYLSKFLVNSSRTYEFFGFEHLLPLWDKDFTCFVLNLKDELRDNFKLTRQVWFKYYFEPFKVPFTEKEYPFFMQKGVGIINRSKRFLYTDMNNFKYIAKMFLDDESLDVHWDSVRVNINTIQSTWYIKQLEKKFK